MTQVATTIAAATIATRVAATVVAPRSRARHARSDLTVVATLAAQIVEPIRIDLDPGAAIEA